MGLARLAPHMNAPTEFERGSARHDNPNVDAGFEHVHQHLGAHRLDDIDHRAEGVRPLARRQLVRARANAEGDRAAIGDGGKRLDGLRRQAERHVLIDNTKARDVALALKQGAFE